MESLSGVEYETVLHDCKQVQNTRCISATDRGVKSIFEYLKSPITMIYAF